MTYVEKLIAAIERSGSALCVGLDPRPERHENRLALEKALRQVIEETCDLAACFKPNIAYFEAMGWQGIKLMEGVLKDIPSHVPVIMDCKRSDIGETQKYYAQAFFDHLKVDAVTVNGVLGEDSLRPFFEYQEKGIYMLGVTSNPGAKDVLLKKTREDRYFFETVVEQCQLSENIGLVVGLQHASAEIWEKIPDVPLLMPGLGAQGGEINLGTSPRQQPAVINVSRGIMYGAEGQSFQERAKHYHHEIASKR